MPLFDVVVRETVLYRRRVRVRATDEDTAEDRARQRVMERPWRLDDLVQSEGMEMSARPVKKGD